MITTIGDLMGMGLSPMDLVRQSSGVGPSASAMAQSSSLLRGQIPTTAPSAAPLAAGHILTDVDQVVLQTAANIAAGDAAMALVGHLQQGAFGTPSASGATSPNATPAVGPTTIVAATPSVVVPGVTAATPSAAVDTAAYGPVSSGGAAPTASPTPGAVSSAGVAAPAVAPTKTSGLTTTEIVAGAVAVAAVAGFVLVRRGKKKR